MEQATLRQIFLDLRYAFDPALLEEDVAAAITRLLAPMDSDDADRDGVFALSARRIAEAEYATRIEGRVQAVPGVLWARVDALGKLAATPAGTLPEDLALPTPPAPTARQGQADGLRTPAASFGASDAGFGAARPRGGMLMTEAPRVPLYDRLPEIYRIRDAEQTPPGMLAAYLRAAEDVLGAVHENIEALYDDLFIETCDDWVVPYIADLLGTTHLKGEARTLRADVADTIPLRRRKGTLSAIERLARNLTGWPERAVEMRPNVGWSQHLNHQRPDRGGRPPYGPAHDRPLDPARRRHGSGTRPGNAGADRYRLRTPSPSPPTSSAPMTEPGTSTCRTWRSNLWRLAAYRLQVTRPLLKGVTDTGGGAPGNGLSRFILRVDFDPLDRAVRLFNVWRRPVAAAVDGVERLTEPDAVAAPILPARLESGSEAGNPAAYISVDAFDDTVTPPEGLDLGETGIQLYFPASILDGVGWRFRADNLCAWEDGIVRPLALHEISIDPILGRMLIGLASAAERDVLVDGTGGPAFFTGYSYGAVGPVGAHPISRQQEVPPGTALRVVDTLAGGPTLQDQLENLHTETGPVIVEIRDSMVHELNPETLAGALSEGGRVALRLAQSVTIRAVSGARPIIRLARPLGLRPADPGAPQVRTLTFRLEGVFVTRAAGFPAGPRAGRAAGAGAVRMRRAPPSIPADTSAATAAARRCASPSRPPTVSASSTRRICRPSTRCPKSCWSAVSAGRSGPTRAIA